MNWKRIAKYAALLLATGIVIGFLEGEHTLAGQVAHLVAYTGVFAHMARRQYNRAFLHAGFAVLLSESVATLLLSLIPGGLSLPGPMLLLDLITSIVALAVGTSLGISLRPNRIANPDPVSPR